MINYLEVKKSSKEEQIAIYMKQSKKELAEMLYNLNSIVDDHISSVNLYLGQSQRISNRLLDGIMVIISIFFAVWLFIYVL